MYVLVDNNVVVTYPYTLSKLQSDNPDTSFPGVPGDWMIEWGVYQVVTTTRPAYDKNFNIVEGTPVNIGGVWTQVWNQVPASAQEIAERTQMETDIAAANEVKLDAFVQSFLAFTPAGLDTYIDNNTANLAQMRTLVKKMAKMLLILARQELR